MQDREFVAPEVARRMGLEHPTLRQILNESLRYWEPRRIAYNLMLAAIVGIAALRAPQVLRHIGLMEVTGLLVLAVLANLCYSAAYVPDVVLQYSGFRSGWVRFRPVLFWFGMVFAALLAASLTMPDVF